jgi:hypothetical protein
MLLFITLAGQQSNGPQSQGAVEHGNSPFQEALFKWI